MNIVIIGAGAIGSFFGAMLSKNNNVFLVGRKAHIDVINKNGLKVDGKTNMNVKVAAFTSTKDVYILPDLVIFAVKSYDK
jgi:2-dehydropantoate 2-reductase